MSSVSYAYSRVAILNFGELAMLIAPEYQLSEVTLPVAFLKKCLELQLLIGKLANLLRDQGKKAK